MSTVSSEKSDVGVKFILILGLLSAFGPMSIDLYLPALPFITDALQTTDANTQFSLTAYFAGFTISQMVYGTLSDSWGRRPVLLFGIGLFSIASILCALTSSIEQLIALRFIQALGAGAGVVVARAVVRDHVKGTEAARIFSIITLVMQIAPMLAPIFGSLILELAGWRMNFWILFLFGILCLVTVIFGLPESLPHTERSPLNVKDLLKGYVSVLRNKTCLGYTIASSAAFGGMFAHITLSSFIYQDVFGLTSLQFSYVFSLTIAGMSITALANTMLVQRFHYTAILRTGTIAAASTGVLFLIVIIYDGFGIIGVILPLCLYMASLPVIAISSVTGLLDSVEARRAGLASSVFATVQTGFAGLISAIAAFLYNDTVLPLALLVAGTGLIALISEAALLPRKGVNPTP